MDIGFIIDPLDSLKAYKDTSVAIMYALLERRHRVWVAENADLAFDNQQVLAQWQQLNIEQLPAYPSSDTATTNDDKPWYQILSSTTKPLTALDGVLMRQDPPFDENYLHTCQLLAVAANQGARVLNPPRTLTEWNEKLAILQFPNLTPHTLVSRDTSRIKAFINREKDVILKPINAMGGTGIFHLRQGDSNISTCIELLTDGEQKMIMAQTFVKEISAGDKRILLIDGEPLEHSIARIPAEGEHRGNLAAGASCRVQPLSDGDKRIVAAVAPAIKAQGLFIVGLDVIGNYLTEINITSPTCLVELEEATGLPLKQRLVQALENNLSRPA